VICRFAVTFFTPTDPYILQAGPSLTMFLVDRYADCGLGEREKREARPDKLRRLEPVCERLLPGRGDRRASWIIFWADGAVGSAGLLREKRQHTIASSRVSIAVLTAWTLLFPPRTSSTTGPRGMIRALLLCFVRLSHTNSVFHEIIAQMQSVTDDVPQIDRQIWQREGTSSETLEQ
jgi:hypothetical protein